MEEIYVGSIFLWTLNWVPDDLAFCNGQLLNISNNQMLYSLIGTTYGGDGVHNFGVPDLRSRVPIGANSYSNTSPTLPTIPLNQTGGTLSNSFVANGSSSFTLTTNQIPSHNHNAGGASLATISIPANTGNGNTAAPGNNTILATGNYSNGLTTVQTKNYSTAGANTTLQPISASVLGSATAFTGGGQPVSAPVSVTGSVPTAQPYLALNYVICLIGIYPQRP